jgi:hypothetical protein
MSIKQSEEADYGLDLEVEISEEADVDMIMKDAVVVEDNPVEKEEECTEVAEMLRRINGIQSV